MRRQNCLSQGETGETRGRTGDGRVGDELTDRSGGVGSAELQASNDEQSMPGPAHAPVQHCAMTGGVGNAKPRVDSVRPCVLPIEAGVLWWQPRLGRMLAQSTVWLGVAVTGPSQARLIQSL